MENEFKIAKAKALLLSEGYYVSENAEVNFPEEYRLPRFFTKSCLRDHLLNITGMGSYTTDRELLDRIENLLNY